MTEIKPGYVRVTEVLDVYSKLHLIDPTVLEKATIRGNKVDLACKMKIEGIEPFQLEEEYEGYFNSFKDWMNGKNFIQNPGRMYCEKHKITGECDGIYRGDSGLVLFDIKTPANEGRSWPLQGAAYAYLARLHGLEIVSIEFIKLSKEGKAAKVYQYEYEKNWQLFEKAIDLYKHFFWKKKDLLGG